MTRRTRRRERRASVLLLVLFLMALTAPLLCMILDTHTTQIRCIHNDLEAKTAFFVAQAGVQDAMSELLLNSAWRAGFVAKPFPAGLGHTYTVTLADLGGGEIRVTSAARTAAGTTKTVVATLTGF